MTNPRQLETSRAWKKANPERHAELMRAYRARNKEKVTAHNRLNYAIRKGVVVRQPCEMCGTSERIHAHHHDYSKPLEVRWLCYVCHKTVHTVEPEDKIVKFQNAKRASLPGASNPNAKMDWFDVYRARFFLRLGLSQQSVADMIGVTQQTVSRLSRGKTYALG